MASIINASTSGAGGLISTADNSGTLQLQTAGTTAMTINSSQVVNFANAPTIAGGALPIASGGTGLTSVGTNGQVLTSNGTSLSYTTPSAGAMTLISTKTASNSASLSWTGLSGYNNYMILINKMPTGSSDLIAVQVGTGSTTYITSGYQDLSLSNYNGNSGFYNTLNTTAFKSTAANNPGTNPQTIQMYIMGMTDGSNTAYFSQNFSQYGASGYYNFELIGGNVTNTTTKTAIQIIAFYGSNIASGTASLYGISS